MELNWNKQAKQFLILHNWNIEDEIGFHPCYPLGEDFSIKGRLEKFCESFYSEAWKNYKAYINGLLILENEKEEE